MLPAWFGQPIASQIRCAGFMATLISSAKYPEGPRAFY